MQYWPCWFASNVHLTYVETLASVSKTSLLISTYYSLIWRRLTIWFLPHYHRRFQITSACPSGYLTAPSIRTGPVDWVCHRYFFLLPYLMNGRWVLTAGFLWAMTSIMSFSTPIYILSGNVVGFSENLGHAYALAFVAGHTKSLRRWNPLWRIEPRCGTM